MSNKKIKTLEVVLSKMISADNTEIIGDKKAIEEISRNIFTKKQAIDGAKSYLKSLQSSPRILGLIIYSEHGRSLLSEWIGDGMKTSILYRSMIHDGAFWHKASQSFPLMEEVVHGGEAWDFDEMELFANTEVITAIPGLFQALVMRMRRKGLIKNVFYYLPEFTTNEILRNYPSVFMDEIKEVQAKKSSTGGSNEPVYAIHLISHYLEPQLALEKVMKRKLVRI